MVLRKKSSYGKRYKRYSRKRMYNRRKSNSVAYRALRIARSASRRVAGEVCKFESNPLMYTNTKFSRTDTSSTWAIANQQPLSRISSGIPWIMPLNWLYFQASSSSSSTSTFYVNRDLQTGTGDIVSSIRNPIWYNTFGQKTEDQKSSTFDDVRSTEFQYRLKYIYINALFNASITNPGNTNPGNNTDGALRIVVIKDKQPTGGSATWYDENTSINSRGVFNSQRIDAQLNPNTVGRFRIMYDKTLRFSTINGYKPFKYFKKLSTTVRNNRDIISPEDGGDPSLSNNFLETNDRSPPVQMNAYYLMIFSDGLNFQYTDESVTGNAQFHLFNRIAYYNN